MNGFVDMHCHILPGIDDGASDINETREMLKIARDEGTRVIVATPHHHENKKRGKPSLSLIAKAFREVNVLLEKEFKEMIILPGMEVMYSSTSLKDYKEGSLLYAGKSGYILLEFSPVDTVRRIIDGVLAFQMAGAKVIVAHAERYEALRKDRDAVDHLLDMGVIIQVNTSSIVKNRFNEIGKTVASWLEDGIVGVVGTDAHDKKHRKPEMKKAYNKVSKKYGRDYADEIFCKRGMEILS